MSAKKRKSEPLLNVIEDKMPYAPRSGLGIGLGQLGRDQKNTMLEPFNWNKAVFGDLEAIYADG